MVSTLSFCLSARLLSTHRARRFINAGDLSSHTSSSCIRTAGPLHWLFSLPVALSITHASTRLVPALKATQLVCVASAEKSSRIPRLQSPSFSFLHLVFLQGAYSLTPCSSVCLFFLVCLSSYTANSTEVGTVSLSFMPLSPASTGPGGTVNPDREQSPERTSQMNT